MQEKGYNCHIISKKATITWEKCKKGDQMGYTLDLINNSAKWVKIENALHIQYEAGKSGFRIQLDIYWSLYLRGIVPI